jgi:imidazolonepropionase
MKTLLENIRQIYSPCPTEPHQIDTPVGDTILMEDGRIKAIGRAADFAGETAVVRVSAEDGIVTPGFVDSHQHPLFGAHRHTEFEMRNQGRSYQEIAATGGGIRSSVRAFRSATDDDLKAGLRRRWRECLQHGTTTFEAKSGYGLNLEQELRSLRLITEVAAGENLTVVRTLLAAHDIPDEYRERRDEYIRLIIEEIIPAVKQEQLAECTDIFCEQGVFSVEESRTILTASLEQGIPVRLHADQLSASGGSQLAAELGALSADHLEEIDNAGIAALQQAGVIALLLPGSTWFLRMQKYAPARKLIEAGCVTALATNLNPGSGMFVSQPTIMHIASLQLQMTTEEVLWAATMGGARVLQLQERKGAVTVGRDADLLVWGVTEPAEIPYQPNIRPSQVWMGGQQQIQR